MRFHGFMVYSLGIGLSIGMLVTGDIERATVFAILTVAGAIVYAGAK